MLGPLIPYIKVPEIPLPFGKPLDSIKPFGVLVATGVYIGSIVAVRHARQRGVDVNKMNTFILWVVGLGFVGAHLFDAIAYSPERVMRNPLYLLEIWAGLSSFGGFLGAMLGALAYRYVKKEKVLPLVDTVCSAFPLAWVFGRAGCAVVHDHPGLETTSWLGVQYFHPGVRDPNQWWFLYDGMQTRGRFDLGLIEMLLTIPLATTFAILWVRKPRPFGFYAGWQCVLYSPVRFGLDFLRIDAGAGGLAEADARYFGLTPAQWSAFGLLAVGLLMLSLAKKHPAPASWAEVKPWTDEDEAKPADDDEDEDEDEEAPRPRGRSSAKSATKAGPPAVAQKPKVSVKAAAAPTGKKKKGAKKTSSPKKPAEPDAEVAKPTSSAKGSADEAGEDGGAGA